MRNIVSISIIFGMLLIAYPTQAAHKHAKTHCPKARVVAYKAPEAWWGADRGWWSAERPSGKTQRTCSWLGGSRATYVCR